jgi:hypothetical protein
LLAHQGWFGSTWSVVRLLTVEAREGW